MEDIINGSVDIYAELGISPNASSQEVNRKYRQMARKYHPDKNPSPEAASKFHLFSVIHSVLSQPSLRAQYDEIRNSQSAALNDTSRGQINQFRTQLRQREREAQQAQTKTPAHNTEQLHLRGLALRRKLQQRLQQRAVHVSFRDLRLPVYTTSFLTQPHTLKVSWKVRPERGASIDGDVLARIMGKFGPVEATSASPQNTDSSGYATGTVTFSTAMGAKNALKHNFKKSANLWDGTPERKVASLLRSVVRTESGPSAPRAGFWSGPKPWDAAQNSPE